MRTALAGAALIGSLALLALFLARARMARRLYFDALAIGLTLGATVAIALAPFELRANPLHFSPQTVAFLFAGLPEEAVKLIGAAAFLRTHYLARGRRDVVFSAGALSLAFAALEDLLYLHSSGAGWTTLAFARALTATPFHVLLGLAGGFAVTAMRPGWRGVALVLAAWAGLAAIHGVYDFAVLAPAHPPEALRRLAAWLGLDLGVGLHALMAAAEAAAAVVGGAAALAVRLAERSRGFVGSRALGWIVGGVLAGAAALALAGAAVLAVLLESADKFFVVAMMGALPLAFGVLFIAGGRRAAPFSVRAKRVLAVGGGLATLALALAVWIWGADARRGLEVMRYVTRGAKFAQSGEYERAVEAYGQALAVEPGKIAALSQRAAAEAALSRFDAALADMNAALRAAPRLAPLYRQRAAVNRDRNDPAAAVADLDAALKLTPGDPETLALRGQARQEAGDAKGAEDDLAEARRRAPSDARVLRTLAANEVDSGDLDGALRELNAVLHANPADAEAAFQRGRVWLYRDEPARAHADFLRADSNPAFLYPALWAFLAQARRDRGGTLDLRKRLHAAPVAWPAPVAHLFLGDVGFEAARAAAADDGERCEADFYFAMSRVAQDAPDASASRFRAALKECPASFIEYEGAKAELRRVAP